jgi:2-polyprenyl-3-methyl-5-hydroxy-6-metoxy-1,4-benzoquinol methylase
VIKAASFAQVGRHPDWQSLYAQVPPEDMPWHQSIIDPDVARELKKTEGVTSILDVGTGSGVQAEALANLGYDVTGIDLADSAIQIAREKSSGHVTYLAEDILHTTLTGPFDLALDLGCLHVLDEAHWPKYAHTLHRLLKPAGYLVLKCLSEAEEFSLHGPARFNGEQLAELFGKSFDIISSRPTLLYGTRRHRPQALNTVLRRHL